MTSPPSLIADTPPVPPPARTASGHDAKTLLDLSYDGFYMLFLLKNRFTPSDGETYRARLREFLATFERGAKRLDASTEDIYLAKYAFCALVDETVLISQTSIRDAWERRPLQLEMFGEQLAGEAFFDRLEELRQQGAARLQVLEVFHMCLLMGFQGKYLIEGSEKLGYLTARLGDEIALLKGKRGGFAPHWAAPDRVAHKLRSEVPLWVIGSVFGLAALLAFIGLRWTLVHQTRSQLAGYSQVVKMPQQAAFVTITLP